MRPCDDPAHPEIVGLWGAVEDGRWRAKLLYDGCCVTFQELVLRPTMPMMQETTHHGRPTNVGLAWRTQAGWDGDRLLSWSHLFGADHAVAIRTLGNDGTGELALVEGDRRIALTRYDPSDCIDEETRDVLCTRLVTRMPPVRVTEHVCRGPEPRAARRER